MFGAVDGVVLKLCADTGITKTNPVHGFTLLDGVDGVTFVAQQNMPEADCTVPPFLMPWPTLIEVVKRLDSLIKFQEEMHRNGFDPEDASDRRTWMLAWISNKGSE